MTYEEKKAFLEKYIDSGRQIEELEEERRTWRVRGERVTVNITGMPRSGRICDNVGEAAVRIAGLDKLITARLSRLASMRKSVEEQISMVDDDKLRKILYLKYIYGNTLEQIAEKLNYGYRHTVRLHKRAVDEIKM
ncbi:MAG: hypothetical protein II705_08565 [Clostridia bacterium]|nr:hypothetical protein [Clostridia bacterium]MBQ1435306.1 hypothetical protein [Clostridia bacterium]MBQ4250079.1 hypothetical protein [Clostridia bacterium]